MEALAQLWDDLPNAAALTVPLQLVAFCALLVARLRRSGDRPRRELRATSRAVALTALALALAETEAVGFLIEGYWYGHVNPADRPFVQQITNHEAREYAAVSLALAVATALIALRPLRYAAQVRGARTHRLRPLAGAALGLAGMALTAAAALAGLALLPPPG